MSLDIYWANAVSDAMILTIIFAVLTIPIIAVLFSAGMVKLKRPGIVTSVYICLYVLGIPIVWLITGKVISFIDILFNLIFYFALSSLVLFVIYKSIILLVMRWFDSFSVGEERQASATTQGENHLSDPGRSISIQIPRETLAYEILTASPGEPIQLYNWIVDESEKQLGLDRASIGE